MSLDNVLIIFVKYPQAGLVKTRLAKDIGKENAALLYRLFVETILARIDDESFQRFIFYTPPEKKEQIRNWIGSNLSIHPQEGNDLGERLSNAFKFTFKRGAKRVVTIGTDSPSLEKGVIVKAFKRLRNKECVIGPSLDGGYYLLGLSSFHREIFQNIMWSTNKVFKQTLNILNELKIKHSILDKNFDVDNAKDLLILSHKNFAKRLPKSNIFYL